MTFNPLIYKKGGDTKVLIIYTGGTLGMVYDENRKTLVPYKFEDSLKRLPELNYLDPEIHLISFKKPFDSSDVNTRIYLEMAGIIQEYYHLYDGFLIIHGTDTMAFSASALSFLIQNPKKPIVFTGAQLPIGIPRTDARENLISSIEIASAKIEGKAVVPEVCIYFNGRLLRGNRAKKRESSQFDAFDSENYPYLAEIGVTIDYNFRHIRYSNAEPRFYQQMSDEVSVLTLFPGIHSNLVEKHINDKQVKGVILQTYGSGNAPSAEWFVDILKRGIENGKYILNVSQCTGGKVIMGKYASSKKLQDIGVISGSDMTLEAAVSKMMWALGQKNVNMKEILTQNLAGELTLS